MKNACGCGDELVKWCMGIVGFKKGGGLIMWCMGIGFENDEFIWWHPFTR